MKGRQMMVVGDPYCYVLFGKSGEIRIREMSVGGNPDPAGSGLLSRKSGGAKSE